MRDGRRATRVWRVWIAALVLVLGATGQPASAQETPADQEIRHQLNTLPRISVFDWLQ